MESGVQFVFAHELRTPFSKIFARTDTLNNRVISHKTRSSATTDSMCVSDAKNMLLSDASCELKCSKMRLRPGICAGPCCEACSAPLGLLTGFQGKGKGKEAKGRPGRERERRGREGEGEEEEAEKGKEVTGLTFRNPLLEILDPPLAGIIIETPFR